MSESKGFKSKRPAPKAVATTPPATKAADKITAQPAAQPAPNIVAPPAVTEKIAAQPMAQTAKTIADITAPAAEKIVAVTVLPQPVRRSSQNATEQLLAAYRTTLSSLGESQHAVVSGVRALTLEMTGLAQATLTEVGDSAAALTRARNFADAVEIQLGFARRSFASLIAGSTRLSEIGARLASEASRPIVAPLGGSARVK
jgi:hypothetical protein